MQIVHRLTHRLGKAAVRLPPSPDLTQNILVEPGDAGAENRPALSPGILKKLPVSWNKIQTDLMLYTDPFQQVEKLLCHHHIHGFPAGRDLPIDFLYHSLRSLWIRPVDGGKKPVLLFNGHGQHGLRFRPGFLLFFQLVPHKGTQRIVREKGRAGLHPHLQAVNPADIVLGNHQAVFGFFLQPGL